MAPPSSARRRPSAGCRRIASRPTLQRPAVLIEKRADRGLRGVELRRAGDQFKHPPGRSPPGSDRCSHARPGWSARLSSARRLDTKPTPFAIASAGLRGAIGWPSSMRRPRPSAYARRSRGRSRDARRRASPRARESPRRRRRRRPDRRARRRGPRREKAHQRRKGGAGRTKASLIERPTIICTSSSALGRSASAPSRVGDRREEP